jgi:hypothetical protein
MHPYEMAATLKKRRKEQSIKLRYGSLLPALPPKDVQLLLAERLGRIEDQERQMQADLKDAAAANMPALFLVESEYALALVRTERAYVKGLVRGIETGELSGVEQWQQWHLDHKRN